MTSLWQDIRLAYRGLQRTPGFTLTAVATLAIGIGANAAMFSAVEAVLLRPLPVADLNRLVAIDTYLPKSAVRLNALTPGELHDLSDRRDLFEAVGGYVQSDVNLTGSGEPQRISAIYTAGSLFEAFGVHPYLGQFYDSSATARNANVVVLSYGFWRDLTGSNAQAIGTTLRIDGEAYEIVGVLPPGFRFPQGVKLWTPRQLNPNFCYSLDWRDKASRACKVATTVAKVRQAVSRPQLQSQLTAAMAGWRRELPQHYPRDVDQKLLVTLLVDEMAGALRPILVLLMGAMGFVLLLVCANVACLQLIRAAERTKEIAVRAALGAGRWVVARQMATESLLIATAGGALGVAAGGVLIVLVPRMDAPLFAMIGDIRLDPVALAFAAGITLLTVLLFGIAPALRATRVDAGEMLRAGASRGGSTALGRSRFLRTAVVAQVALTIVLLSGSGVALRSLTRLLAVDPGFRATGLITARLRLPPSRYNDFRSRVAFSQALTERLYRVPGLVAVTTAFAAPFDGEHKGDLSATDGDKPVEANASLRPLTTWVDSNYFQVVGIPFRAGRTFSRADYASPPNGAPNAGPPVIIDQALADKLFPGEDAIGKHIGPGPRMLTVIGVVGSTREVDLSVAGIGLIYFPGGAVQGDQTTIIRSGLPLAAVASALRAAVHDVDPDQPVSRIAQSTEMIDESLAPRRLASAVLGSIGAVALLLAMLGIYGVLSELRRVPWTPCLGVLSESEVRDGDATAVQSGV